MVNQKWRIGVCERRDDFRAGSRLETYIVIIISSRDGRSAIIMYSCHVKVDHYLTDRRRYRYLNHLLIFNNFHRKLYG